MMVADACTIFPPATLQRHEQPRRVRISDSLVEERTSLDAVIVRRYEVLTAVWLKVKFAGMLALSTGT